MRLNNIPQGQPSRWVNLEGTSESEHKLTKNCRYSLFANSSFPSALNSSLSGTITPSVFWSTNMACRWLNVPRPTSWPEIRTSMPWSIDEPKASACMHNPGPKWMDNTVKVHTRTYLCRGEINSFSGLDALQPILDVPLQLRMEFLRKINGILVKERRLTNPSTRIFIEVCSFTRIDGVAGVLERWLKDHWSLLNVVETW